jgi:class 3 adenylate cyclase
MSTSGPLSFGASARGASPDLPVGVVTFLFTDIEGSTRAWLRDAVAMGAAVERHDALIEGAVRPTEPLSRRADFRKSC